MRTALFLILTMACALGATVAAGVGGTPLLFGGLVFGTFVGIAGAAASAAVALGAPSDLKEPREARGPTNPKPLPEERLTRRLFGKLWLGAMGTLGVLGFVPLVALNRKPGRRPRTGWRDGVRLVTSDNRPIPSDTLELGGIATVFPENETDLPEAPAVLIRVPGDELRLPPERAGWAPQGYVAYSKTCTHAGCPVALYRAQSHQLLCPCHQSLFNVLEMARNIAGPAPRPLPQLPLGIDAQGYLVARGDFSGPVGPDDWERTLS